MTPEQTPTRASLVTFADAHGALRHIVGPSEGPDGFYGAFTTKAGIAVAIYRDDQWRQSGTTVTSLGSGRWVTKLKFTPPALGEGVLAATPWIYLRIIGGDISYAGSILRQVDGTWRTAVFGSCGHHGLCPVPGNAQPYLHFSTRGLISISNNCTPDCAGGTDYRVTWQWSGPAATFIATMVTKIRP